MKKTLIAIVAVVLAVSMVLAGCGTGQKPAESAPAQASSPAAEAPADEAPAAEAPAAETKIKVGFSQATMASPFYVAHVESAQQAAEAAGIELIYADANEDITKQNTDILDMLEKGIDVLILNAVDPDGANPAIAKCKEKGVKIVTVDRFVNADVDVVVGRDNVKMGQLVGEYLVEKLGGKGQAKGKVLEVMGSGGDRVQEARSKGFHNAVDAEPGIEVIQTPHCDYVRSKAATATQDIIQAHKDIVAIYGHNDDMALGALQVCEDAGMTVLACGVDGLMEAVEAIVDGRYICTSANDPFKFGQVAVEVAIKLAKGESVDAEVDCGTFLVSEENASQYFNADLAFVKGE
ncbi:MAG: substrate-binding domain-containing protein [Christensenellales bacterium]